MISLILPVHNEAARIEAALQALPGACEVIVVDDGSTDATSGIAARHASVVSSQGRGRGAALDAGAKAARGEILLFLHADTRLPPGALEAIESALQDPAVAGGAFSRRYDDPRLRYRLLECRAGLDHLLAGVYFGDQGLFCRKDAYESLEDFPLFEDMALCRRLRRRGRLVQLPQVIVLSTRRYEQKGILKATFLNYILTAGYYLGVSPWKLWEIYYGRRREGS